MHNYSNKTEDLGHSASTGSNSEHQWSHSSFGQWGLWARKGCKLGSYEIQNEGDGT